MSTPSFSTVTGREFSADEIVPGGGRTGTWIGRAWVPASLAKNSVAGPRIVTLRDGLVIDASARFHTISDVLCTPERVKAVREAGANGASLGALEAVLRNGLFTCRAARLGQETRVVLMAPNDIQPIKACGVTFVRSLLERVVEEKAKGDKAKALEIRKLIHETLGDDLSKTKPGSPATIELKKRLIAEGMWSQYLEVGIGSDAEVFTKAQPSSAVTHGMQIGVLPDSTWNNPEPEVVLAVSSDGKIIGATIGNDVNLRDYEGRSALLLGEAKDQNGSCALGAFIRLIDETFSLEDVEQCEVELTLEGPDGYKLTGSNKMAEISRSPETLVAQVCSDNHQYPDGFLLFLGTMFAPTADRDKAGEGFTHRLGDRVEIATPHLGRLVNWVNHTDKIPRWEYGLGEFIRYLRKAACP
jgi:fumarylacetoacetate (FAA) hydrolase family protein